MWTVKPLAISAVTVGGMASSVRITLIRQWIWRLGPGDVARAAEGSTLAERVAPRKPSRDRFVFLVAYNPGHTEGGRERGPGACSFCTGVATGWA